MVQFNNKKQCLFVISLQTPAAVSGPVFSTRGLLRGQEGSPPPYGKRPGHRLSDLERHLHQPLHAPRNEGTWQHQSTLAVVHITQRCLILCAVKQQQQQLLPNPQITHPAGCMSQFIQFFGEQIMVLWKFALLRKRLLIFSPPPVGVVCYRGEQASTCMHTPSLFIALSANWLFTCTTFLPYYLHCSILLLLPGQCFFTWNWSFCAWIEAFLLHQCSRHRRPRDRDVIRSLWVLLLIVITVCYLLK